MGVKSGVSDIHLPYPKGEYCGLYIEMKYGKNRLLESQEEFLADMKNAGHFVATCYSADDAYKIITEYLALGEWHPDTVASGTKTSGEDGQQKRMRMSVCNNGIWKDGVNTRK